VAREVRSPLHHEPGIGVAAETTPDRVGRHHQASRVGLLGDPPGVLRQLDRVGDGRTRQGLYGRAEDLGDLARFEGGVTVAAVTSERQCGNTDPVVQATGYGRSLRRVA
jgi:hypothetical protein